MMSSEGNCTGRNVVKQEVFPAHNPNFVLVSKRKVLPLNALLFMSMFFSERKINTDFIRIVQSIQILWYNAECHLVSPPIPIQGSNFFAYCAILSPRFITNGVSQ